MAFYLNGTVRYTKSNNMGPGGLSIKNMKYVGPAVFRHALLLFFCLYNPFWPPSSHGWLYQSGDDAAPVTGAASVSLNIHSDTYVLFYNGVEQQHGLSILPESDPCHYVFVDDVNIDIPLDALIKNAVEPGEFVDRLLTVNLRIRRILDEYTELDRRAESLLRDLRIPYLENAVPRGSSRGRLPNAENSEVSVSESKNRLKKKLVKVIKNSQSFNMNTAQQMEHGLIRFTRSENRRSFSITRPESGSSAPEGETFSFKKASQLSVNSTVDVNPPPPPLLFRVWLKGIRYCLKHKFEIILYTLLTLSFILLISLKRKQ